LSDDVQLGIVERFPRMGPTVSRQRPISEEEPMRKIARAIAVAALAMPLTLGVPAVALAGEVQVAEGVYQEYEGFENEECENEGSFENEECENEGFENEECEDDGLLGLGILGL
jgi:hypothetical protein